jgi:hypothetical protein
MGWVVFYSEEEKRQDFDPRAILVDLITGVFLGPRRGPTEEATRKKPHALLVYDNCRLFATKKMPGLTRRLGVLETSIYPGPLFLSSGGSNRPIVGRFLCINSATRSMLIGITYLMDQSQLKNFT